MARLFIDGYECGTQAIWDAGVGSITSASSYVITGNYSMRMFWGNYRQKSLDSTYTELYSACNFRTLSKGGTAAILLYMNNTSVISGVRMNSGGYLGLWVGTSIVTTSTYLCDTAVVARLEFHYKQATADGQVSIRINNVTVCSYVGNTVPATGLDINAFRLGFVLGAYSASMIIDDVVLDSTVWPGNGRIVALSPSSPGDSTDWTPSASSNWECVDEIPPSTVDYVHSNTTGALDLYKISGLTTLATNVNCIQLSAQAEKEGTPAFDNIYVALSLNGTVALSSALTPGAAGSPIWLSNLWETNPMTGSSFTISQMASIQIGVQGATT